MGECIAYSTKGVREFVETQIEWPHSWTKEELVYDVVGFCKSLSDKQVKKALNLAMTTWDLEIKTKFTPKWFNNKQADITIDFKSGAEDKYFKERPSVLAYAYFPNQGNVSGKVVFNDDYIWSLNGNPVKVKDAPAALVKGSPDPETQLKTYNIIHVFIHELGHSLGLHHDAHNDTQDVMDPFYSGKLELSDWDLYRIRLKYTPRVFSNWAHYDRLKKAVIRAKSRL